MFLKKITLTNFRQFYGTQELLIAGDLEKNVTLIHAENGVGNDLHAGQRHRGRKHKARGHAAAHARPRPLAAAGAARQRVRAAGGAHRLIGPGIGNVGLEIEDKGRVIAVCATTA